MKDCVFWLVANIGTAIWNISSSADPFHASLACLGAFTAGLLVAAIYVHVRLP